MLPELVVEQAEVADAGAVVAAEEGEEEEEEEIVAGAGFRRKRRRSWQRSVLGGRVQRSGMQSPITFCISDRCV